VAVHLLDMVRLISWVMGMEPFVQPLRKDSPFELVDTEPFVGNLDNFLREVRDMVNCGKFLDNWFVGMEDLAGEMDMVLTAEAVGYGVA
jgi:hypothetical protein